MSIWTDQPTPEPPGPRGLKTKQGIFGLVLMLLPAALLLAVAIDWLTGASLSISLLNLGRGIGSSALLVFLGWLQVKSAWTGEEYRGHRARFYAEAAERERQYTLNAAKRAGKERKPTDNAKPRSERYRGRR